MESDSNEKHDPSFLFSLNLMVLGGVLLLLDIITLNKLLNHYLSQNLDQSRGILYSINITESDTFRINSIAELYLNWFGFILALIGLVVVIHRLVKTWSH